MSVANHRKKKVAAHKLQNNKITKQKYTDDRF